MSPRRKKKNDLFGSVPKGSFSVGARSQAWGRGGSAVSAGGSVWTIAGWALRGGFPPGPGRGIQAFSRESPDAKSRGGGPPPPLVYGPLVPTRSFWRLWRIVPVEGLFRCPCTCPDLGRFFVWGCTTQRLPLGGKLSPKVTDEGAILYPTFPCRKIGLSPQRLSSPAPLGESIAPSSAPVCALGHLWFMVASPGPDRTVPRTVRPPRGRLWGWEFPCRVSNPLPSNGLARQGTPRRVSPPAGGERK